MKILIAGGAGYIGSMLAPALVEDGYEVEVIDLLWFDNHLPKKIKVKKKDLFKCTDKDFKGFDQVVFLAGLSNDPMAEFSPSLNFIHNAALPSYLAFQAKKAKVKRFVYASSCSVYGFTVNQLYDENSPVTCSYPYGISKLQGERGVHQMEDESFSVISLRKGTVCGYSPRMRMDLIVNTMFKCAMTENRIIVNNPSIWRPILHIKDTVAAYTRAIQADYRISGVFNVSSGNYTVGHVADVARDEIQKLTKKKINMEIKSISDFRNYKVTIDKAKTELGYQPRYDIKGIIDNLYDNKDKCKDYNKDEYYNVRVFKSLHHDATS